jgi:hypothetical protein
MDEKRKTALKRKVSFVGEWFGASPGRYLH